MADYREYTKINEIGFSSYRRRNWVVGIAYAVVALIFLLVMILT